MIKYYWIELETQLYMEYEYSYEGIEETQVQVTTPGGGHQRVNSLHVSRVRLSMADFFLLFKFFRIFFNELLLLV